jgi:type III secretion protein C
MSYWQPRAVALALLLAAAPAAAQVAVGAPAGSKADTISITARDQPIADFLRDLFGRAGRPVVVSPGLTGTVNGRFDGSAAAIFRQVSGAFNIASFDDGAALYAYPAADVGVRTFPLGRARAQQAIRTAAELQMLDGRNRLRVSSDGTLVASGVPRFLDQVADIARSARGGETADRAGREDDVARPGRGGAELARHGASAPLEFRVFYLRHARAEDTSIVSGGREVRIPGLATILRGLVMDPRERELLATGSYGSRALRPTANRLRGQGLASVGGSDDILGLGPADVLVADGGVVPMAGPDTVRIEANPALNALIVRDSRARMRSYEGLIVALDIEPQLVQVEATIIDINTTKLRELGVDWRLATNGVNVLFGNGSGSDLALTPDFRLNRRDNALAVTPAQPGLSISTVIGSGREFLSRISALEQKGAARIVSRPQVMTVANVEAVFDRTRTFYVRVAGREEVDLFNVTVGTVLRINPHVVPSPGGARIQLLVQVEDGQLSATEAVDGLPIVDRAGVSTRAIIVDGESLLLGGQTIDSEFDAERKIPLLGDIPVLGNLFKNRRRSGERVERLFMITPRLLPIVARAAAPAAVPPASGQGTLR